MVESGWEGSSSRTLGSLEELLVGDKFQETDTLMGVEALEESSKIVGEEPVEEDLDVDVCKQAWRFVSPSKVYVLLL